MIEGRRRKTALPVGQDWEERSEEEEEEERRQRWMDGQIKQRQQPLNRGLTSLCKEGCEGEQVWCRVAEKHSDKGRRGRMEVEDSGCQDWRWDGVRSHFSSVIALSVSPPLSSLSNYDHNAAGPFLQSCIWLCGCKAAPPQWNYAVIDGYTETKVEMQRKGGDRKKIFEKLPRVPCHTASCVD
ncbi:hypothetical protein JOB18_041394 [Xyrichtys novacula]|uniref:Uncharacterized protein n=1 Tax=Xyrichtys novacula TaxID=13765 RepID=A0AAV1F4L7_XYRNO|nr:hypothetical protein JOB18_041394 [Xyrichtys novacula]